MASQIKPDDKWNAGFSLAKCSVRFDRVRYCEVKSSHRFKSSLTRLVFSWRTKVAAILTVENQASSLTADPKAACARTAVTPTRKSLNAAL